MEGRPPIPTSNSNQNVLMTRGTKVPLKTSRKSPHHHYTDHQTVLISLCLLAFFVGLVALLGVVIGVFVWVETKEPNLIHHHRGTTTTREPGDMMPTQAPSTPPSYESTTLPPQGSTEGEQNKLRQTNIKKN